MARLLRNRNAVSRARRRRVVAPNRVTTESAAAPREDLVGSVFTTGALAGRRALVTGGTRGIGRAIALAIAAAGGAVTVTWAARESDAESAAAALSQVGGDHAVRRCDVRDAQAVATLFAELKERGGVDVLVNNAGIFRMGSVEDTSVEMWHQVMDVNALGVFLGMKAVAATMVAQQAGSIVNISSIAGMGGSGMAFAYGASKWAVRGMTKSAAQTLARHGVRCNSIHPGIIDTDMLQAFDENGVRDRMRARIPLGREASAEEVARLALYLASDESAYSTGSEFVVDGGMTA
jgi:3alpha(or 20beta)-hydroxysteroid dehydrogenase